MAKPTNPAEPNLHDAQTVADLLDRASDLSMDCPLRHGSLVRLANRGLLWATGDLHDHGVNLQRVLKLASLDQNPNHHLILHEIIHGPNRVNGRDMSVRTLVRVAAWMIRFPTQIHVMLANHELAQINGDGILKGGVNVVDAFNLGVEFIYGDQAQTVHEAVRRFVASLPLAVGCSNGVFCSHSLPAPRQLSTFDPTIIHRVPTRADLTHGGHAYQMVWGRKHTQATADTLGQSWDAKLFVMGHQPAEAGHRTQGDTMLILASDHAHGVALPVDLSKTYQRDELVDRLVPLASVTPQTH